MSFSIDVLRHADVDLARELDELCRHSILSCFPCQIERVERYAVSPKAWAGVEAHEAEGLGLGGVEHLPDVDAHAVVDDLELVDQGDVDGAEDVLGQLGGLGGAGRGDPHGAVDRAVVERLGEVARDLVDAADHLWGVGGAVAGVAGVLALGREGEEELLAAAQPGLLEDAAHELVGGAGVGGRLEHDELARAQRHLDLARRLLDEAHVRLALRGQRRRHADQDRVDLA